ncbi:MAG: DUF6677 family protein [bacterium]|nr:hypothetical protein [Candidatus Sumerlaeota bacterium]
MNCAKCGNKLTVSARVCPRCHYFGEQDRTLVIEPPRARKTQLFTKFKRFTLHRLRRKRRAIHVPRPLFAGIASIIPGMGHIVSGRIKKGLIVLLAVAGLLLLGIMFPGNITQMGIGLAAALHAYSIVDVIFRNSNLGCAKRSILIGALLLALLNLFYWRFAEQINRTSLGVGAPRIAQGYEAIGVFENVFMFIPLVAILLLLSFIISQVIYGYRQSRADEKQK